MKIIGTIPKSYGTPDFIVHMDAEELALIAYGNPYPDQILGRSNTEVGTGFKVSPRFHRAGEIDRAQDKLNTAAKSLRALADLLVTIDVVVPVEVKKAEELKA